MVATTLYRSYAAVATLAACLLAATSAEARDTRTEEPVFDFSSPFVSPRNSASPSHYIWKINRIDGSLYLCQTTTAKVRCNQVAGPNGELGPFTLSDAIDQDPAGFHVWRLNRWTGSQELCVASGAQHGCSK